MDYPVPDENVPTYVEHAFDDHLAAWTASLQGRASELRLPVTYFPPASHSNRFGDILHGNAAPPLDPEIRAMHVQLITALFTAVRAKNTELVTVLVSRGFVSPDCTDSTGRTPLYAAVDAGNGQMVCTLVGLGAQVDAFSFGAVVPGATRGALAASLGQRTPLMLAAQNGNLALVRLLVDDFGADDALVAPDGQLALRLAADAGHRDVVAFLPARRGGAFRRWKVHHGLAWRRIRQAAHRIAFFGKCLVWYLPQGLFWYLPKYCIVLPLRDAGRWAWRNRAAFAAWCKEQARAVGRGVRSIPGHLKTAGRTAWNGIKAVPGVVKKSAKWLWGRIKAVPRAVWLAAQWVWGVIKATPAAAKAAAAWLWGRVKAVARAVKIAMVWVWQSLQKMGRAVGDVALRLLSLLHTTMMAVLDFFRSITLSDIWNGVCSLFRAVFVDIPAAIWSGIKAFGEASYKFMDALFGFLGKVVWWIVRGLIGLVTYVPQQIWEILVAVGGSTAKGYQEFMVWVNPKR